MFHIKYRPKSWDEVIGNDSVIKSIRNNLSKDPSHFFMLIGDRGTGKTTIARLIAKELGIENIEEINAAASNGVDFARDFTSRISMKAFGKSKLYIVDECQRLTPEAQDILLKDVLEDTPDHAFVVFCTTNPEKIKQTVISRAAKYNLKKPDAQEAVDYLVHIAFLEEMDVPRKVLTKIVKTTDRVMRESLVLLNQIKGLTEEEANDIIVGADITGTDAELIELARVLIRQNVAWDQISSVLSRLKVDGDSAVIFLQKYMSKVLLNSENGSAFNVLLAAERYRSGLGMAGLVRVCYESYLRSKGSK